MMISEDSCLKDQLTQLHNLLSDSVIGQTIAIRTILASLERYLAGLHPGKAPIGTYLFVGMSGCGKSYLVEEFARLTQPEDAFIRIDCSEYSLEHEVSRLLGAPPGYQGSELGSQLTNKMNLVKNKNTGFILLLDEIEKAHPRFFDIWLQVFESGRFTDGKGNILDFSRCMIFMTSNVGSANYMDTKDIGFRPERSNATSIHGLVTSEIKKTFRPEFINRLSAQVHFNALDEEQEHKIFTKLIRELNERLAIHEVHLTLSSELVEFVFKLGFSKEYGARELKRTLIKYVEHPIAQMLISGEIQKDSQIIASNDLLGNLIVRQVGEYPILVETSS